MARQILGLVEWRANLRPYEPAGVREEAAFPEGSYREVARSAAEADPILGESLLVVVQEEAFR